MCCCLRSDKLLDYDRLQALRCATNACWDHCVLLCRQHREQKIRQTFVRDSKISLSKKKKKKPALYFRMECGCLTTLICRDSKHRTLSFSLELHDVFLLKQHVFCFNPRTKMWLHTPVGQILSPESTVGIFPLGYFCFIFSLPRLKS